jgi:hypothetical protein
MTLVITRDKINKRLKKKVKERIKYGLSIFKDGRKYEKIFLTLTFKNNEQYLEFKEIYKGFINNIVKNYGVEFVFRAEELQERGVMHIHLFVIKKKGYRIGFIDKEGKYKDKVGMTNIKVIRDRDIDNVANYMLKYLMKSLNINVNDKIKNKVKKRIRRYSIWIPKKYKDINYKLIMANNKIEKLCILKGIKIKREGGYRVIINNNKTIKYKFIVSKNNNDNFELYIEGINFIFFIENDILYEKYEIENEQDLKEIYELIINLMDLN